MTQYVGDYRISDRSTDAAEIERWESVSGRVGALSIVLYLERDTQSAG